ncbi:MAG: ABC transporter permease [Actinobacteria bacterium]|nr:ABC transporter permease [Actinomycetota bacterium]
MSTLSALVARRAALDYARRPLNLVLLVAVPIAIVVVWSGSLAQFSKIILGGKGDRGQIEAATAGWAAAALAGLAGFFQVIGARPADRRLSAAGGRTAAVVAGRLGASFGLAVVAATGGLVALSARTGIDDPIRAMAGTVVIAVVYLSLGVLVGTFVRSEMNGALLVTLVWVFDVFFGPALGPGSSVATRLFPMHYPTLVLMGQASGHAGPLGDVGWSLLWALGLAVMASFRLWITTRPAPRPHSNLAVATTDLSPVTSLATPIAIPAAPLATAEVVASAQLAPVEPGSITGRLVAVMRGGSREYRRNRVLWMLLVAVPAVFIGMAVMVTVDRPGPISLVDGGRRFVALLSERRIHAATMVPIASAFLAGITGLFVVTESAAGDRRLVLAGFRAREVLAGRLGVIGVATVISTAVAVTVSGMFYAPQQWVVFVGANLLIALTYAVIGVLVGPLTGRLGGLYLILLLAFIDVGLGQSVMFPDGPPAWGAFLPARGASRIMIDGAFTGHFDQIRGLLLGLAWLGGLSAMAATVFQRRTGKAAPPRTFPQQDQRPAG